jgi:hypothetical protein
MFCALLPLDMHALTPHNQHACQEGAMCKTLLFLDVTAIYVDLLRRPNAP